ncbi:hypothetical protein PV08_05901 [Exophiala spinifera]|uniref:Uncharacterized protein n=1 Tax=Exophiala spinifera TaxID=91928 RepID=A0A0D1YLD9_9EURO|nr:uncharacterized protein PV08_05901 [Exophiala spinifera]KIW15851.1 hypothetical protein PV08_05901 [Exophiala spinifera]
MSDQNDPTLSPPLRPFRTKDDLDEEDKDELEILIDRLTLSCDNLAKAKPAGTRRRFGRDDRKDLETDLENLFVLLNDWLSRPRASTTAKIQISEKAKKSSLQLFFLLETYEIVTGAGIVLGDDFVEKIFSAAVDFVAALELEEVLLDNGEMWKPASIERWEPSVHGHEQEHFSFSAPTPEEAAREREEARARIERLLQEQQRSLPRPVIMDRIDVHTDTVKKKITDISKEQVNKEAHYHGMLGKKWLETAQERLENLGRVEIAANEEPDETLAVDHDRAGTPDDDDLLRYPDADYVPRKEE